MAIDGRGGDSTSARTGLTLEQIEDDRWGDPQPGATRLVATVHALRRVPVGALSVEDLRLLVGQHVGLPVVLPLALGYLERDPLIEGELYPGDLLSAVLQVPAAFWADHPAERARMGVVAERAAVALAQPADSVDAELLVRTQAFAGGAP